MRSLSRGVWKRGYCICAGARIHLLCGADTLCVNLGASVEIWRSENSILLALPTAALLQHSILHQFLHALEGRLLAVPDTAP